MAKNAPKPSKAEVQATKQLVAMGCSESDLKKMKALGWGHGELIGLFAKFIPILLQFLQAGGGGVVPGASAMDDDDDGD